MNTYQEFRQLHGSQNALLDQLGKQLKSFPCHANGLVLESVRTSPEYRVVDAQFKAEFKKLQEINKVGVKKFKKEINQEYKLKRMSL